MPKKIILKLVGIRYDGVSIGNDVWVEIDVFGKTAAYDAKLKQGESIKPNLELGSRLVETKPFEISAIIRVIERDVLFPDKGQIVAQLKVDPNASFPQRFTHSVTVRESRGFLTKRTARFEITIEARPSRVDNTSPVIEGRIALYQDIEQAREANLRKSANTKSPILATLQNDESIEIIEKIVRGEYIENKSNIWHKVRHIGKIGYILSSFVEIAGAERTSIIALIQKYAHAHGVDDHLAIAPAGCESRYKPYAVSIKGALGVFQLTSITCKQLSDGLNFPISENERFDSKKNIEGGIRYLKWISERYVGTRDADKKIIAAWNAGRSKISLDGPFNLNGIDEEKRQEIFSLIRCTLAAKKKPGAKLILTPLLKKRLLTPLLFPKILIIFAIFA